MLHASCRVVLTEDRSKFKGRRPCLTADSIRKIDTTSPQLVIWQARSNGRSFGCTPVSRRKPTVTCIRLHTYWLCTFISNRIRKGFQWWAIFTNLSTSLQNICTAGFGLSYLTNLPACIHWRELKVLKLSCDPPSPYRRPRWVLHRVRPSVCPSDPCLRFSRKSRI